MLRGPRFAALATDLCQKLTDDVVLIVFHNLAARLILAC